MVFYNPKANEAILILCKLILIMENKFPDNVPELSAVCDEYLQTDL